MVRHGSWTIYQGRPCRHQKSKKQESTLTVPIAPIIGIGDGAFALNAGHRLGGILIDPLALSGLQMRELVSQGVCGRVPGFV